MGTVVVRRCWHCLDLKAHLLARIGVKSLLAVAVGAMLNRLNLSQGLGKERSLLGGAGTTMKQPNPSARIGVKSF